MAPRKKPEDTTPPPASPEEEASGLVDVGPDAPPPPAGKLALLRNKKVMIGGAAALLLVAGGGGAAMMLAGGEEKPAYGEQAKEVHAEAEEEEAEEEESAEGESEGKDGELPLVDVPPMIVNLRTTNGEPRYLKIRFMLEAKSAEKTEKLKAKLPLIIDSYQPFLRELRPEDISGSAAVFRIKEEMLVRATEAAGKGMVKDVLIQDLVQQ
ncbi:flagellar basal body-associated FliL family protein [Sphingobium fluviale]|nr:flagellar basal body-associated FliL family protein [Sphingobium fluviale]